MLLSQLTNGLFTVFIYEFPALAKAGISRCLVFIHIDLLYLRFLFYLIAAIDYETAV